MKNKLTVLVVSTFLLALIAGATLGCRHTAHGAGRDIERMGEKIQDKTE
jgi:predicted small secreted protein